MRRLNRGPCAIALLLCGSAWAATLTGDTSHPGTSVYIPGEPIQLSFHAEGLGPAAGLTLELSFLDERDRLLEQRSIPVEPAADGTWTTTLDAPGDRLGFVRVRARLSDGTPLAELASRPAGFLTYAVVRDPAQRQLYPQAETYFGLQPHGLTASENVAPLLGVRWVLGGYTWRRMEPDRPGQAPETHAVERAHARPPDGWLTYPLLPTFAAPDWAVSPASAAYESGELTPAGETAWADFCRWLARTYVAELPPELEEHIYQITWEPVYPWGYKGSDESLVRIYEIAYPILHELDPKAVVAGPTGAGIGSDTELEWNTRLLRLGLGRWIDAFSIHPYQAIPPERAGLVDRVRRLREIVRAETGREMPLLGTEQGSPTGQDPSKELDHARGLVRENLIMFGEGFRLNFGFYLYDYLIPSEVPGYGYFYNLVPGLPWGTSKIAPKPIAPAFAAQSFLLEGHRSAGPIEWLGETALGYAFERGDHVVLALWDYGDEPRPVSLAVGAERVTVYDWMGNAIETPTPGGTLPLTLAPEPLYVEGVSPGLWGSGAARPVALAESRLVGYPGGRVSVAGDAGITDGAGFAGSLTCEADPRLALEPVSAEVGLEPERRAPFELTLGVPADAEPGTYPLTVTLREGARVIGVGGAMLVVKSPVAITRLQSGRGPTGEPTVLVGLRNETRAELAGSLAVSLRGVPETTRTERISLAPGAESAVTVAYAEADLPLTPSLAARAVVTLDGGGRCSRESPIDFLTATRGGEGSSVILQGREALVRAPAQYRGFDDLSADLRFGWDDAGLLLSAAVTDDTHLQEKTGFDIWQGDCLQVAFDLDPGREQVNTGNSLADSGSRHRASEINVALTPEGPQAFRAISFDPAALPLRLLTAEEWEATIEREEGWTRYAVRLNWAALGLAGGPDAGLRLGVAVTVNDRDSAEEREPKALGLFGGITPTKDPMAFGTLLLGEAPAPRPTASWGLEPSGTLGQSHPEEPLPFLSCTGAAVDAAGRLWTLAGDTLYGFAPDADGQMRCLARQKLRAPAGPLGTAWDGERLSLVGWDRRIYSLVPGEGDLVPVGEALVAEGARAFAVASAGGLTGYAARGKYFALEGDSVRAFASDGADLGLVLTLTRPAGAEWHYCALGLEPLSGDLLVGSYWPDAKVYRYDASGAEVARDGWPRAGHAASVVSFGGEAWMVALGGGGSHLPPIQRSGEQALTLSGIGTMYSSGIARAPSGGYWAATSQGLVSFDARGRLTGERLGGIEGIRALAIGSDGAVVAAVEGGQRMLRLSLGDGPDTAFTSNANEPWRAGNGWTARASALAWDAGCFLVADEVGAQLWHFDPEQTGYQETPWPKVTEPGSLAGPRACAVGDTLAWVGDSSGIRELARPDGSLRQVELPGLADAASVVALAAEGDGLLLVALPDRVLAYARSAVGGYALAWRTEALDEVRGLALGDGFLAVSERIGVRLIAPSTGEPLARHATEWTPGAIAAKGRWVLVADDAGKRLVRMRVVR